MPDSTPLTADTDRTTETQTAYEVLARKYRPRRFEDLIGHEAMVRTLANAFTVGRIAHAYILTGVRGVGKTTTARILARALNYQPQGSSREESGPQIRMVEDGVHCQAIAESRHPDVMEMDAASRTGVGDIRELIEGVRYAPIEARYKVYIIDEVHMLSTAAFNALLKTLEEPPPHVKFIFATTEIRKVPITVLSRCQRFDLRRIEPETLIAHLEKVAEKEGVHVDLTGMGMIVRAAEGSVRDALSILDQAIVQHGVDGDAGQSPIQAETIRDMLGLADRSQSWALLDACFEGVAAKALEEFRRQYDEGADPVVILRDLLELVHLVTRVKAAGHSAAGHGPAGEAEAKQAIAMSERLSMGGLTRAWSLLMKGLEEVRMSPDPVAAGEMAIIRLCFATDLPTPDEALRQLKGLASPSNASPSVSGAAPREAGDRQASAEMLDFKQTTSRKAQMAEPPDVKPADSLRSLDDIARLAGEKKDIRLRTEIEGFVHIVAFETQRITIRLADDAPEDLPGRLMTRLKQWTGVHWVVTVAAHETGEITLRDKRRQEVEAHPLIRRTMELFPGARIEKIVESERSSPLSENTDILDEGVKDAPEDDCNDAAAVQNSRKGTGS